jgi:hypothetical protein
VGPRAGLDRCGKSLPHRDSIPGTSSPVAQSLYRLSYRAHNAVLHTKYSFLRIQLLYQQTICLVEFIREKVLTAQQLSALYWLFFYLSHWCKESEHINLSPQSATLVIHWAPSFSNSIIRTTTWQFNAEH